MRDNVFIDTNIFIYALTEPKVKNDIYKREIAIDLLQSLINRKEIFISVQIINEIHMNMVRKFKIEDSLVFHTLQENILAIASIKELSYETYKIAFNIRQKYNISYWDSLVIASAFENRCSILYSEDMQNGLILEDRLQIINPFSK
jgi:predicted nucleic acid-binding protein